MTETMELISGKRDQEAEALRKRIKAHDTTAKNINPILSVEDFLGYTIYYIEWISQKYKDNAFYWASIDKNGTIRLYQDGVEIVKELKEMLERRRNIIQRLGEFGIGELIAAIIALVVTGVFTFQIASQGQAGQELTGIFGIILGYYFGKNIPSSR